MNTNTCCPDRSLLQAYQEGTAGGDDFWKVQNHLEECEACRALLQEFPAVENHTLWISGRSTGHPESGLPGDRGSGGSSAASRYPFLLPSAAPGEMGRLGGYRILKLLGKGGMGYVFHAEDLALCRAVALKVMKPDLDQDINAAQRFLREARAMASIKHEALVTVFQVSQENGVICLAMELLQGETLADWQTRLRRPKLSAILRIARGIAGGLAAIHERGLVHRDLKPTNLWIEPGGNVKILDFGLARLIDDTPLTQSGTVLGTPSFMSPEQARGKPVDPRSDLFSLGSVLYSLCTGKSPFHGTCTTAILTALALDDPYPIERRNPKLPKALAELVTQLLAKAPEDRPASAEEVLERLSQIEAEPAAAQPVEKAAEAAVEAPSKAPASSRTRRLSAERPANRPASRPVSRAQPRASRPKKRPVTGRRWLKVSLAALPVVCAAAVIPWVVSAVHRGHAKGATVIEDRHDKSVSVVDNRYAQMVYLTDLQPIAQENWPFLPPSPPGLPPLRATGRMRTQGKEITHGIFMHPPPSWDGSASLTYNLDVAYQVFRTTVSLHEGPGHCEQPLTFSIYGDDRLLWKSQPVTSLADTQNCSVSVQGVKELKLVVTSAGDARGGHAVWVDPAVGSELAHENEPEA